MPAYLIQADTKRANNRREECLSQYKVSTNHTESFLETLNCVGYSPLLILTPVYTYHSLALNATQNGNLVFSSSFSSKICKQIQ